MELKRLRKEVVSKVGGAANLAPHWTNAYSFGKIWRTCDEFRRLVTVVDFLNQAHGNKHTTDRFELLRNTLDDTFLYTQFLGAQYVAHVLCVPPEQVNALPPFASSADIKFYFEHLNLPFDPLYIDFEQRNGEGILFETNDENFDEERKIVLAGVLIAGTNTNDPETSDHTYDITPVFMWQHNINERFIIGTFVVSDGIQKMRPHNEIVEIDFPTPYKQYPWYNPILKSAGLGWMPEAMKSIDMINGLTLKQTFDEFYDYHQDIAVLDNCSILLPLNQPELNSRWNIAGEMTDIFASAIVMMAVERTLATLYLLESAHVEIEDVIPDKRSKNEIKRAAKRDLDSPLISKTIYIPSSRKAGPAKPPSGTTMEYNYRFETRGHYKHFGAETRLGLARPERVKSCQRCGKCIRVWCPPFIKGSEDKPFIPKSRVLRQDES